jgi:hypothetical protein
MKWVEFIPLTHVNEKVVIHFIEQQLIIRFGVPYVLVFDNAAYFSSTLLIEFPLDKGIIIRYSTNYYPWGNGVEESTKNNLLRILKKTVADNQMNWHNCWHVYRQVCLSLMARSEYASMEKHEQSKLRRN